jgi:hypothetical protein
MSKKKIINKKISILEKKDCSESEILNNFNKEEVDYIFNNMSLLFYFVQLLKSKQLEESMYIGRSLMFLDSIMSSFFILGSKYKVKITPNLINDNLKLDSIQELYDQFKNESGYFGLIYYIHNIPTFDKNIDLVKQDEDFTEYHHYVSLELKRTLNKIVEKYDYKPTEETIFKKRKLKYNLENF